MSVKEKLSDVINASKDIVNKSFEVVKDKTNTFSGQKLLEQNQEYYDKVTQILVGLDFEIQSIKSRLNSVSEKKAPGHLYFIIALQFIAICVLFYLVLFNGN